MAKDVVLYDDRKALDYSFIFNKEKEPEDQECTIVDYGNHSKRKPCGWECMGLIPVWAYERGSFAKTPGYSLFKKGGSYQIRDEHGKSYYVAKCCDYRKEMYEFYFDYNKFFNL